MTSNAQRPATSGSSIVQIEAEALRALATRIAGAMSAAFERALQILAECQGRVVVTGMGKSGIIGRKIAATMASTGTPAMFLHPAEAIHGDLGMLVRGDCVLALSASGETEEILRLLATVKRLGVKLITFTGDPLYSGDTKPAKLSTLASAADVALDCSIRQEACPLGLAPSASTTTMLALGDALALALAEKKGFREEDFADLHPGGKLGKKLARVSQLMHSGDALPRVSPQTGMTDLIYEMSRKGLGVTAVTEGDKLVGIISDGDLRRLLQKRGTDWPFGAKEVMDLKAADFMTRSPRTVEPEAFAATALSIMEEKKITSLPVVEDGRVLGIVHLHDLWGTEMI